MLRWRVAHEGNASTGTATLRRDGFAALTVVVAAAAPEGDSAVTAGHTESINNINGFNGNAGASSAPSSLRSATAVSRPVVFNGGHFFVNARAGTSGGAAADADAAAAASVRVQVLNATTLAPIKPFTLDNCIGATDDSSRQEITWAPPNSTKGAGFPSLAGLAGIPVRFEFELVAPAQLFSFWLSSSSCGDSGGFAAAGGPRFVGGRDTLGQCGRTKENSHNHPAE